MAYRCSSVSPSSHSSGGQTGVSASLPPTTFSFTALAAAPRKADTRAAASFLSSASTAAAAHSFAAAIEVGASLRIGANTELKRVGRHFFRQRFVSFTLRRAEEGALREAN